LLSIGLIVLLYAVITPLPKIYYEKTYDITFKAQEIDLWCYFYKGTDTNAPNGLGHFDVNDTEVYTNEELCKEIFEKRIEKAKVDPIFAAKMLMAKDSYVWTDPSFHYTENNRPFSYSQFIVKYSEFLTAVPTNKIVSNLMDGYMSIILLLAAVGAFFLRKHPTFINLGILFAAGFLYHSIFETSPIFMYPYFVTLMPISAIGVLEVGKKLRNIPAFH
jgi:hypothetical protein